MVGAFAPHYSESFERVPLRNVRLEVLVCRVHRGKTPTPAPKNPQHPPLRNAGRGSMAGTLRRCGGCGKFRWVGEFLPLARRRAPAHQSGPRAAHPTGPQVGPRRSFSGDPIAAPWRPRTGSTRIAKTRSMASNLALALGCSATAPPSPKCRKEIHETRDWEKKERLVSDIWALVRTSQQTPTYRTTGASPVLRYP